MVDDIFLKEINMMVYGRWYLLELNQPWWFMVAFIFSVVYCICSTHISYMSYNILYISYNILVRFIIKGSKFINAI